MKPTITETQDKRWPIMLDCDAGSVFLTLEEAHELEFQLLTTLLDMHRRRSCQDPLSRVQEITK